MAGGIQSTAILVLFTYSLSVVTHQLLIFYFDTIIVLIINDIDMIFYIINFIVGIICIEDSHTELSQTHLL